MSQQELNGAQVGPGFEQVGCKTVPKRMGRDRFDNAATLMRLLARMLYRRLADMPADLIAREEPLLEPGYWPPVAQDLQQLWRKQLLLYGESFLMGSRTVIGHAAPRHHALFTLH